MSEAQRARVDVEIPEPTSVDELGRATWDGPAKVRQDGPFVYIGSNPDQLILLHASDLPPLLAAIVGAIARVQEQDPDALNP